MLSGLDATQPQSSQPQDTKDELIPIRVLALHGSEGTGERFLKELESWKELASAEYGLDLQMEAIDAPIPKGPGFSWWSLPPLVRSYNATTYEYFETSSNLVLQKLFPQDNNNNKSNNAAFDLVLAFSQGAILVTSLLALDRISNHPKLGYILIGSAWPNPFTNSLESKTNPVVTTPHEARVLMVIGDFDRVNPPEHGFRIQRALINKGYSATLVNFPGGHKVPTLKETETLRNILSWIQSPNHASAL